MNAANKPPIPSVLGRPLAPLYGAAVAWRNQRFDRGRGVVRLPVPVISVGNLSVGGTGKTPMVAHLVGMLLQAGGGRIRPCIAMRGYTRGVPRGGRGGPGRSDRMPDETDVYRRLFPGVPVVAQPDRAAGVRALLKRLPPGERPTCAVLDDGFQHRGVARDLDIVLIDASRPPGEDRLLPAGWLREPVESLRRADLVVVTHAEMVEASRLAEVRAALPRVDAVARHRWTGLVVGDGEGQRRFGLDWLLGKRVVACCAIGNPAGFIHSLRVTLGGDAERAGVLAGAMVLPDHDPYGPEIVATLARMAASERAEAIVVTDKDWSKLRHVSAERWGGVPVVRPVLAMVFDEGEEVVRERVVGVAGGGDSPLRAREGTEEGSLKHGGPRRATEGGTPGPGP